MLEVNKEQDAAKEAFNGATLASSSLVQVEGLLLPFGIPGNNGDCTQDAVDPVDETQAPIGRIQADDARAKRKGRTAHSKRG